MTLREMERKTREMRRVSKELNAVNDAWDAGFDCAFNGANDRNCHFGWFSSPSFTRAWEAGKREGERRREPKP